MLGESGGLRRRRSPSRRISSLTKVRSSGNADLEGRNHRGGVPVSLFGAREGDKSVYRYVGTKDFTLFPLIRPGSFVQIDANQTKVDRGAGKMKSTAPSTLLNCVTVMPVRGANRAKANSC